VQGAQGFRTVLKDVSSDTYGLEAFYSVQRNIQGFIVINASRTPSAPPLAHEELVALADDLKRNGQRQPVIIFEGRILDGRNRYEASKLAGLKSLRVEQFDPAKAGCSPASFVISQNLMRRHLSVGQRAAIDLSGAINGPPNKRNQERPFPIRRMVVA
jgi:ParB-like nuclease domain